MHLGDVKQLEGDAAAARAHFDRVRTGSRPRTWAHGGPPFFRTRSRGRGTQALAIRMEHFGARSDPVRTVQKRLQQLDRGRFFGVATPPSSSSSSSRASSPGRPATAPAAVGARRQARRPLPAATAHGGAIDLADAVASAATANTPAAVAAGPPAARAGSEGRPGTIVPRGGRGGGAADREMNWRRGRQDGAPPPPALTVGSGRTWAPASRPRTPSQDGAAATSPAVPRRQPGASPRGGFQGGGRGRGHHAAYVAAPVVHARWTDSWEEDGGGMAPPARSLGERGSLGSRSGRLEQNM